jgi:serine/threonine protein phosphatase PrpC
MEIKCFGTTITGRRSNNQDAFLIRPELGLFLVADGMGGYEGGEVASRIAVATIETFFKRNVTDAEATWPFKANLKLGYFEAMMETSIRAADAAILAEKKGRLANMGTTVAVLWQRENKVLIGHAGDSRIYRLRGDKPIEQLTTDHSLYEQLKAQGSRDLPPLSDFSYANVITRALGMLGSNRPDVQTLAAVPGDKFLLCTDGLSGVLADQEIAQVMDGQPAEHACRQLVDLAFERKSKDNITAVVVSLCL